MAISRTKALKKPAARKRLPRPRAPKPVRSFGGYFKGAWQELRAVRWPNRRATWSLTFAVLVYTAFFVLVILGLDTVFNYLFKEVLL